MTGQPIDYAVVSNPNSSYAVVAGATGEYTLNKYNVSSDSIIRASRIGYEEREITVEEARHSGR